MNSFHVLYFAGLFGAPIGLFLLGFLLRRHRGSGVALMLGVLGSCFALLESASYWRLQAGSRSGVPVVIEGDIADTARYYRRDPILGYRPAPGFAARATKRAGAEVVYDVRYRIGSDGFRSTPGSREDAAETHLFLGDSVTFGEGVEDHQVYPAIYAQALGDRHVINAAFSGYGPQHALEILRTRGSDLGKPGRLTRVYFLVCCEHDRRFAGLSTWEKETLRFALDERGELVFLGLKERGALARSALRLFSVKVVRALLLAWRLSDEPVAARVALLEAGLLELRLRAKSLGAQFALIYLPGGDFPAPKSLRAAGIEVLVEDELLSAEVIANRALSPHDPHPNPRWHSALGHALAQRVIAASPTPPAPPPR